MRRPSDQPVRDGRRRTPSNPEPYISRVLPVGFTVFCTAALIVLVILAVWIVTRFDWAPVIDFIAPSAARARAHGWVAISEGI